MFGMMLFAFFAFTNQAMGKTADGGGFPIIPLIIFVIGVIGMIFLDYYIKKKAREKAEKKRQKIEALGEETYNELKNNFDARGIMGEMNYIIDQINEYWEQNEYFRESKKISNSLLWGPNVMFYKTMGVDIEKIKEEAKLFDSTKKKLDVYIKKEWNPRIRILRENSKNYSSDKELRDGYIQFKNVDKEIQKLTIEGKRNQQFNKILTIAGFGLIAATGLALGAVGAANRAADRQSFRDNFGA